MHNGDALRLRLGLAHETRSQRDWNALSPGYPKGNYGALVGVVAANLRTHGAPRSAFVNCQGGFVDCGHAPPPGIRVSSIIAAIAFWRGSLSASGAMAGVLIGGAASGFGGWTWGLLLLLFFVTSSALSRFREADNLKAAKVSEKGSRRDLGQVLANSGVPAGLALVSGLATWEG